MAHQTADALAKTNFHIYIYIYIYIFIYLFMYLFIYLINYSKVLEADGRRRAGRLARQRVRTAKKTPSIGAILNTGLEALKLKSAKSLRWIRHQR